MQASIIAIPKVLLTGTVVFIVLGFLLWEHFHGGVPSHHILQQKELPAISNWWNIVFLPVLTWILLGRIEKRRSKPGLPMHQSNHQHFKSLVIFSIGVSFAILISVSFVNQYTWVLDNVLYALLLVSLGIPIFYAEFILGFVLGMTFTFGAILPTLFILILAAAGFVMYRFIRPLLMNLINFYKNKSVESQHR